MALGFSLILTGLIFFFNPLINLLDLLPDFLGCIFIYFGLSKLSCVDEDFLFARKSILRLLPLSVIKFLCGFMVNASLSDYALPFAFIFGILDIIFMLSFFKSFYSGLDYTGRRLDSCLPSSKISEVYTMSLIFVVATRVLDFVPQILFLIKQDMELDLSHNASYKMPIGLVKPYLTLFCFICSFILGIIFIVMIISFFKKLFSDKNYACALKQKYETFLFDEHDSVVNKSLSRAFMFMMVGVVFIVDFSVDAINILPSFVALCLFYASFLTLSRLCKKRSGTVYFIIFSAICIANYIYFTFARLEINHNYSAETFLEHNSSFFSSLSSIYVSAALCVLQTVVFIIMIFKVLALAKEVFQNERRSSFVGMIKVQKISFIISFVLSAISQIITSVFAYISNNEIVSDYISNKAFIRSEKAYELLLSNPMIRTFENLTTLSTIISICLIVTVLWNIYYLGKTNRTVC